MNWKYANGATSEFPDTFLHKIVYRVKDSTSRKIDVEIEPTVKWKPKLISLYVNESLTFFSLGAAHASQVYTKTVARAFTSLHKDRKLWLISF